jgi:hypothetical protein
MIRFFLIQPVPVELCRPGKIVGWVGVLKAFSCGYSNFKFDSLRASQVPEPRFRQLKNM